MNASKYRKTRFEVRILQQGPNSFGLICTLRGKAHEKAPPLEVPEELFTEEEMSTVHTALGILEEKFAIVYDEYTSDPNYLANEIKRERAAHMAELERVKNEAAAEKKRLEEELNKARSGSPNVIPGNLITLR